MGTVTVAISARHNQDRPRSVPNPWYGELLQRLFALGLSKMALPGITMIGGSSVPIFIYGELLQRLSALGPGNVPLPGMMKTGPAVCQISKPDSSRKEKGVSDKEDGEKGAKLVGACPRAILNTYLVRNRRTETLWGGGCLCEFCLFPRP